MSKNPIRQYINSTRFLICALAAGFGLSACTQIDEMFDDRTDAAVSAPAPATAVKPRDEVKAASLRCDSITNEHDWLSCYYGAAQPVRAELGLQPAPQAQQDLVPPPPG